MRTVHTSQPSQHGFAGSEVVCPDIVDRSDGHAGVQLTQPLEGVHDALTPRPCGDGVLVWCCDRLHRGSQLLGHRPSDQASQDVARHNTSHTTVWFCERCHPSAPHHADDHRRHLSSRQVLTQLEQLLHGPHLVKEWTKMFARHA